MRKLVLFMHVSLDGFVGGPKGEMDWIRIDDEIFEYASQRTNESDTALYGRVTYQMMEAYWPTAANKPNASKHDIEHSQWYNNVEKVVASKTLDEKNLVKTKIINSDFHEEIRKLKQAKGQDILMLGSPTAAYALMRENLIDDYWLFVNPVLLGKGISLFKDIKSRITLKLREAKVLDSDVVVLHYEKD